MKTLPQKKWAMALLLAASGVAVAATHTVSDITPALVGAEGNGVQIHVGITPNPTNCLYSGVYFSGATERNAVLSTALAAKLGGKKLRIIYTQANSGAICIGDSIYIE